MKRKPEWLKTKIQGSHATAYVKRILAEKSLHTVCIEANCPNKMECFEKRNATFMILGRHCTRDCTFCNVSRGVPDAVDKQEPEKIAEAVRLLGLSHTVITSVTRDDLPDCGAGHFARVLNAIRKKSPEITTEVLIPDMQGKESLLEIILKAKPDVLNHNVETVPSLYPLVRPMADFPRSLNVLNIAKQKNPQLITKSGLMLGLGETREETEEVFRALASVNCDILTIGQYLQPSEIHVPVAEYFRPEVFERFREKAINAGLKKVIAGPLVRSSYRAGELIINRQDVSLCSY